MVRQTIPEWLAVLRRHDPERRDGWRSTSEIARRYGMRVGDAHRRLTMLYGQDEIEGEAQGGVLHWRAKE